MNPSDILTAAADLIEPEGCWTQNAWARDASGKKVGGTSFTATRHCAGDAIFIAAGNSVLAVREACQALRRVIPVSIAEFNDAPGRKQSEVVAALPFPRRHSINRTQG